MKFEFSILISYIILQLFSPHHLVHGQKSGDVRIISGTKLLEVFTDSWGYVCDDFWSQADSNTVCRQLGHRRAQNYSTSIIADSDDFKIDDVFCPNNQFYINECEYETTEDCAKDEHVEVICELEGCESLLQSVASISQTAYFYQDYQWQYICTDSMTQQAADVICRSHTNTTAMSFTSISSSDADYDFPIYGYKFNCSGSESSLCECVNIEETCSSMEVVQITCYASENGAIRLTNEDNGLLQVLYNGKWGYICDDGWTDSTANEICKILGYEGVITSYTSYYINDTTYLLNLIRCFSGVTSFLDCVYSIYIPGYCSSNEHVYINCRPNNQCESILKSAELGLSELEYNNGTKIFKVCADEFTTAEGEVVCRENTGTNLTSISSSIYNGTSEIYPATFQCKGYEDSLCECSKMLQPCLSGAIVYVECSPQENGNIRINNDSGLLEVYIDGWGYVCDDYWDQTAANTVCRQLGQRRARISSTGHYYDNSDYKIDDVMCRTNQFRINDCTYKTAEDCSSFEHVAVVCETEGCESLLQSVASISQTAYFYQDYQWQYICTDGMTQQAADVICRSHTNTTAMRFTSISSSDVDYDFQYMDTNSTVVVQKVHSVSV
ncbi:Deleted in malignant brain tumors 1 protein-like isoform X1 [Oopsacas minuta]|uniref:Deleted in malignant brain tumors 1 protein-like isoform X1 n=1 Tax=Oopsacas minuta TaxID=111878 RepID=A0AAV7KE16_9METZ|nr:Deleted in malignant brain tumors 1 protein-like isoform X1 [Oopsacas minuta]